MPPVAKINVVTSRKKVTNGNSPDHLSKSKSNMKKAVVVGKAGKKIVSQRLKKENVAPILKQSVKEIKGSDGKKGTRAPAAKSAAEISIVNGSPVDIRTGNMFVGCHVSAAGGVHNAVTNAVAMGATSFAMFMRSQRSWNAKPLEEEVAKKFRDLCNEHKFAPHLVLPHGSYLINLGSPKEETRRKSLNLLIEELERCSALGITQYNIHPGSSCGEITREECITLIAEGINTALNKTNGVKIVLENMSKQGNTIGGDLKEIKAIMDLVKDKSRIGVCIDTCHAMAAGYDLSTEDGLEELVNDFDSIIGFEWLVALHLNDSKAPVGSHLDRHENIGKGKIGKEGFQRIMANKHFTDLPLILETPFVEGSDIYSKEIKMLADMSKNKT